MTQPTPEPSNDDAEARTHALLRAVGVAPDQARRHLETLKRNGFATDAAALERLLLVALSVWVEPETPPH